MFKFLEKLKLTVQKAVQNFSSSPHKTTWHEERAYWGDANGLSANAYITPELRRQWRNIARYEANCNSYAKGLVLTLADVGIGTGARLQLLTENKEYNSKVEQEFAAWSEAVNLGDKLKTLRKAKCVDGEAFAIIVNNPKVKHAVKMDLRIIESDRVTTPYPNIKDIEKNIDGIHYDNDGNPVSYDVLKQHPGDVSLKAINETESIPAEFMLHWYRQDRPEQSRGLTELLPSLPLFAQLRRYTKAVIKAAEVAADIVGIVKSPNSTEIEKVEKYVREIEPGMFNILPEGYDFAQLKAEQPTTTYSMFKREILSEIGRCLGMPVNIILGDSSNYNYASGRLDHQTFFKNIKNEQNQCEKVVLFKLLEIWYREAVRVGIINEYKYPISQISSQYARFYWDGLEHVDPVKEVKAMVERVNHYFTNQSIECARLGHDWEDVVVQAARERKLLKELGLTVEETLAVAQKQSNKNDDDDDDDDDDDN